MLAKRDTHADRRYGHGVVALASLLGAGGVLAAAAAVGTAIGSVHRVSAVAPQLHLAGVRFSYPSLNSAEWLLVALAAQGATAAAFAARAAFHQRAAYRRFLGRLEVVGRIEGDPAIEVIADPRPQAFCAGYLRPRVYVSQRALDLLTESELRAVLAHERHHHRVRDPLRFACGRILARALFFLPVLRSLYERYADLAELNADRAAIRACAGEQAPLASALLVFDASAPPGVSGISSERVDSLFGHATRWRPPLWLTVASLASLITLGLLVWRVSELASAHATLNLPFLSSEPCVVISVLLLALGGFAIAKRTLTGGGQAARRSSPDGAVKNSSSA